MEKEKRDFVMVLAAYILWGILPLYWHALAHIPPYFILCNRILWAWVLLLLTLALMGRLRSALERLRSFSHCTRVGASSLLISSNWLIYVWAMGTKQILPAGMGYFLAPLITVALSTTIAGESLSRKSAQAIGLLCLGVMIKVVSAGVIPWLALSLAISWAFYVALRKSWALDPIESLFQELSLALPAVLVALSGSPNLVRMSTPDYTTEILLFGSGAVTVVPLLLLSFGLRTVRLQISAMLQYFAPTLTIVVGVLSGEPLMLSDFFSLPVIWLGIFTYFRSEKRSNLSLAQSNPLN